MIEAFEWVVKTYGQEMVCRKEDGSEAGRGMAIVQPMTKADWQYTAGAIGPGCWLDWGGGRSEVMTVRPIWVGGQVTHLWLALGACGENAP